MTNPLARDLDSILAETDGLWNGLRRARLFLTGGTGFFGCWLLESLLWADAAHRLEVEAVVLTRSAAAFARKAPHLAGHPAVTLHEGDLRDFAFPEGRFSHVIHAAAETSTAPDGRAPRLLFEAIVEGTRRTLDFARRAGVSRFLLTSSGAVYGRQPSEITHLGEDYPGAPDPTDPRSAYGEGKRAAELLVSLAHHEFGLGATIARCFAFVGPGLPLDAHFAAGNFLRDGLDGGPIRVGGDGTPFRSYMYAADLAVWLWTILLRGVPCRPYNVGGEDDMDIATLAKRVAAFFGTEWTRGQTPVTGALASRYVPSTARARLELGLRCLVGLEDALERTVRWHRDPILCDFPLNRSTA